VAGSKGSKPLALVLVGITLGVGVYFALSEPKMRYALSVDQAWEKAEQQLGRDSRLQGVLVPGTLKRRPSGCGVDFALQGLQGKRHIFVHYDRCALPDMLCDLAPSEPPNDNDYVEAISVDGELERRGGELHFMASQMMTMCPPRYWYAFDGGPSALCARHRPGFYCPMCEGAGGPPHGVER
jgi:hypothetical protein